MSKEELFKKYQEIILKTNGGADDYVVALCQISNLIKEFAEEKDQQIAELKKQLEEKEKDNQFLKKMYLSERTKNDNYHTEKYGLDKPVEELRKIKLTPKEKEIYYKGFDNCERQFATHIVELQQQLAESEIKLEEYKKCNCKECMTDYEKNLNQIIDKYMNENIKLKQQLHDLPKKIVEEIKDDMSKRIIEKQIKWEDNTQIGFICNAINECLDAILKKFGGENE